MCYVGPHGIRRYGTLSLVLQSRHERAPRSIPVELLHRLGICCPHHLLDVEVLGIDVAVIVG